MSEKIILPKKYKEGLRKIGMGYLIKEIESGEYAKRHLTEWPND